MSYVKVKRNGKILKVQMTSLNVASISMIFKLNPDQGIYLVEEKEGEVILPDQRGDFGILEVNNNSAYLVEGEEKNPLHFRKNLTKIISNFSVTLIVFD